MSSYKFGNFTARHVTAVASSDVPSECSVRVAAATMDPSHHPAVQKRPPSLSHSKRSATIHGNSRSEKVKGVVITSPGEEVSSSASNFYLSDASGIATIRQIHANRHLVVEPPQSEPHAKGFTRASTSHSADNLLSHSGIVADGSSSDEGGDMMGECFICYIAFDEDCPKMTPRNLQCGHAFCTGE